MIQRIEIDNFMSHRRTVIEPAAGLTVIVGPNNCGKSAIVSALQILCENTGGDYMVSHEAKECSVAVVTDDGHRIEWRRKGTAVSYTIDGEELHRLNRKTPPRLHELLRLPKVPAADGNDPFDIHFGLQKSPIFLLNETGSRAATFFASSSDTAKLLEMQALHREKLRGAGGNEKRLAEEAKTLHWQLQTLEPVAELGERATAVQQEYDAIAATANQLTAMRQAIAALNARSTARDRLADESAAMQPLRPAPTPLPAEPLAQWLAAAEAAQRTVETQSQRCARLAALAPPPVLVDTAALEALLGSTFAAQELRLAAQQEQGALDELGEPPALTDVAGMARICGHMAMARTAVGEFAGEAASLTNLQSPPRPADTGPLAAILRRLHEAEETTERATDAGAALVALPNAPALADVDDWVATITALQQAERMQAECAEALATLHTIASPPPVLDCAPLMMTLASTEQLQAIIGDHTATLAQADHDLAAAAEALRQCARDQQLCPICGTALEGEHLINWALAGGEHAHR